MIKENESQFNELDALRPINVSRMGKGSQGISELYNILGAGNAGDWTSSKFQPYPHDPNDGRE